MHGFQNNLAKLFSFKSKGAIGNICSGMLTVKVIREDQMIKWSKVIFFSPFLQDGGTTFMTSSLLSCVRNPFQKDV